MQAEASASGADQVLGGLASRGVGLSEGWDRAAVGVTSRLGSA
ncbi:hypothetical protein [Streptomyces spinoverrucosus]|nr:hypothetical protein [Streptomyces spinoverrucosus]